MHHSVRQGHQTGVTSDILIHFSMRMEVVSAFCWVTADTLDSFQFIKSPLPCLPFI